MSNEKDILEKHLESFNDVFSDMMNVFIFGGNEVINENDPEDVNPNSFYVENAKTKEQERDVTKKWRKKNEVETPLRKLLTLWNYPLKKLLH